jgi:hypothetical protein
LKDNTVEKRMRLFKSEIDYYNSVAGGARKLEKNGDLPTSIPKKISLLYQAKINVEDVDVG